jgi:hypothetical protein
MYLEYMRRLLGGSVCLKARKSSSQNSLALQSLTIDLLELVNKSKQMHISVIRPRDKRTIEKGEELTVKRKLINRKILISGLVKCINQESL